MPTDPSAFVETQVRIGDLRTTGALNERLVTVGLGSCIGVAVIDRASGAVGLAHVFLPAPPSTGARDGSGAGTYASTAVPQLVQQVVSAGAARTRRTSRPSAQLVAVVAGGARMFASRPGTADVGERNIAAVEAALQAAGVRVVATDVGGSHGRTMRVVAGTGTASVTVRQVGAQERELWAASREGVVARAA